MQAYVGITDYEWYELLASRPQLDEVNFWQPGGGRTFRALQPGELFLFKLHAPRHSLVGGAFFAHATRLEVSLAWEAFGEANGATSLAEMRTRIEKYRKAPAQRHEDYKIGCILLAQPFFLPQDLWIPALPDWHPNIVQGKSYDLHAEPGRALWGQVEAALRARGAARGAASEWPAEWRETDPPRYGEPTLVRPRLGQGSFRILVTDAYERRIRQIESAKRSLPLEMLDTRLLVRQAAHLKDSQHRVRRRRSELARCRAAIDCVRCRQPRWADRSEADRRSCSSWRRMELLLLRPYRSSRAAMKRAAPASTPPTHAPGSSCPRG